MREKFVTRTVTETKVKMVTLDLETMTPNTTLEFLPTDETDETKLLKIAHKLFDTETIKVVKIEYDGKRETLYGVKEQVFLSMAVELDPITRKPLY